MKKAKSGYWSDIKAKKGVTEKNKKDEEKDPQMALVDMMKDLYETGDEQMKKTISESWSKAQHDRASGDWKGTPPGMKF
jgi:calcyclin binding protein